MGLRVGAGAKRIGLAKPIVSTAVQLRYKYFRCNDCFCYSDTVGERKRGALIVGAAANGRTMEALKIYGRRDIRRGGP